MGNANLTWAAACIACLAMAIFPPIESREFVPERDIYGESVPDGRRYERVTISYGFISADGNVGFSRLVTQWLGVCFLAGAITLLSKGSPHASP